MKATPQTKFLMKTSVTRLQFYMWLNVLGYGLNNYFAEVLLSK